MRLKLQCGDLERELGLEATCSYVARGENMEELMADMGAHAKEVHGYTDEQLQDPKTVAAVNAATQEE